MAKNFVSLKKLKRVLVDGVIVHEERCSELQFINSLCLELESKVFAVNEKLHFIGQRLFDEDRHSDGVVRSGNSLNKNATN